MSHGSRSKPKESTEYDNSAKMLPILMKFFKQFLNTADYFEFVKHLTVTSSLVDTHLKGVTKDYNKKFPTEWFEDYENTEFEHFIQVNTN
jgi:hypothetical protein